MKPSVAVVDTNVISYILKGDSLAAAYKQILPSAKGMVLSFQTVAELDVWLLSPATSARRRTQLQAMISGATVFHSSEALCYRWALLVAERHRIGRPMPKDDAWIAAVALEVGCPLVTHNIRHFSDIPGLAILSAAA